MTDAQFFNCFRFHLYSSKRNYATQTDSCPSHFFGRILSGQVRMVSKHKELLLEKGDIFFIPKGLKLATHHTNATGTLNRYPECRSACVDETALYNHEIYTELICDKIGIHVQPYLLRLVKKIKGDDKIILISDSFVEYGPIPDGELYEGADDINFDFAGEICGTKFQLDAACHNMMVHTGASMSQVFKYASLNPATMLGLQN